MPSVLKSVGHYAGVKEIILVDDASTDESLLELKFFEPNLKIIRREKNGGFSAACNTGAQAAQGEILFFLNTDVELPEGFFNFFNEHFDRPDTFAVTVKGYQYRTGEKLDGAKIGVWRRGQLRVTENEYPDEMVNRQPPYESFVVQGAYFFVDKKKFQQLEGFDELFSPYIFEETDLCYRARQRGWKIYYEPRCVARHDHSSTLTSIAKKRRLQFISQRNRLIFTWKNVRDTKLLISHFANLGFRLLIFTPELWSATIAAARLWPQIRAKRNSQN